MKKKERVLSMREPKRKLLFFDIDGTIAMPGNDPSEETLHAIRKARENGHLVFLCTGRASYYVDPRVMDIGFDGGIYCAGGRVHVGDRLIADEPIDPEKLRRLVDALLENGIAFDMEAEDGMFSNCLDWKIEELPLSAECAQMLQGLYERKKANSKPLCDYRGEPVYKVTFMAFDEKQREMVRACIPAWGKLVWFDAFFPGQSVTGGEISDRSISKASAMGHICEYYHAAPEDCIAFGDSMNDVEILQAAGIGIAMGNADEELKAVADRICESCGENGIAKELKRMQLA